MGRKKAEIDLGLLIDILGTVIDYVYMQSNTLILNGIWQYLI